MHGKSIIPFKGTDLEAEKDYRKKKIGTLSFRKKFFGLFRDLNPGPIDSDASSLPTELYSTL